MDMMEALKNRWTELQPRDQLVLRLGAIALCLLLFYLLIVDPIVSARDDAEQRLQATREALTVMRQQAADLKAVQGGMTAQATGSLLTQVERSAGEQGLRDALRRLQPNDNDQIQVSLEGASYDQLMEWLTSLRQQGVRVQRADIQVDRASELLEVQLLLER